MSHYNLKQIDRNQHAHGGPRRMKIATQVAGPHVITDRQPALHLHGRKWSIVWLLSLVVSLSLAACREEPTPATITPMPTTAAVLPTETAVSLMPTPTLQPIIEATATATAIATPEPEVVEPDVTFRGVSFSYRDVLPETTAETVTAVPRTPGAGIGGGHPEHIRFTFGEPAPDDFFSPYTPQILVYPVANYEGLFQDAAFRVAALRQLLVERPTAVTGELPLLPFINAAEVFHSQVEYVDFQNGSGVRFVTAYAQGVDPLTNQSIFYTFQGLTDDGRLYVSAFFPVSTAALPDNVDDFDFSQIESTESWLAYLTETTEALGNLNVAEFIPDLTQLDGVIESLLATTDDFPPPVQVLEIEHEGVYFIYDDAIGAIITETIPAQMSGLFGQDGPTVFLEGVPDYRLFRFETEEEESARPAFLVVQPVRNEQGQYYTAVPTWQRELVQEIQERSLIAPDADDFSQPLEAQSALINFQTGSGIRSIVHLSSTLGPEPVTNQTIYYVFRGMTFDGRYYIWLQYPVDTPSLADDAASVTEAEMALVLADYDGYVAEAMQELNALPATAFIPDLASFDSLLENLYVVGMEGEAAGTASECTNESTFISDVTIPDGAILNPDEAFTKVWRVRNSGDCVWTVAYRLSFVSGHQLGGPFTVRWPEAVLPGQEVDISVELVAPAEIGFYQSWWELQDAFGRPFGPALYVEIEVAEAQE